MNEIRRNVPIDEQLEILKRGVVDLVSEDDLRRKLARSQETGQPLRVKLGADPTRPDLHLGHAVILRKMRQFQDLGHKVIMLIGDFTAMIGDPSGKSKTRPPVTLEQTRANAQSYLEQCKLILRDEPEVLELRFNSEWLEPMGYADVIRLASRYTVARIMERDDFKKRFEGGVPISMHELLYPLTQGYDSVALHADIELGGTDQLFNNLVGRALQRDYDQEPQIVMTLPLLVGTDGTEKMSKSLDNYIGLTDNAEQMYEKLMKVPDRLLGDYFELLTDLKSGEIQYVLGVNPIMAHRLLAKLVSSSILNGLLPDVGTIKTIDYSLYVDIFSNYDDFNNQELRSSFSEFASNIDEIKNIESNAKNLYKYALSNKVEFEHDEEEEIKALFDNSYLEDLYNLYNELYELADNLPDIRSKASYEFRGVVNASYNIISDQEPIKKYSEIIDLITQRISERMKLTSFTDNLAKSIHIMNTAEDRFRSVAKGGIPDNIPSVVVPVAELDNSLDTQRISMAKLVVLAGLEPSNGAARKLIQNRGLRLNGETYTDPQGSLSRDDLGAEGGAVLQKGKDKFARLTLES